MKLDTISEARLACVHPVLAQRIRKLAEALAIWNVAIRVTQGIRTVAQQDALYAQGRTAPGKIVTDARGMQSNHVMGYAVDVVPMQDGLPDWNEDHPDWQKIVSLAPTLGLRSGKAWNDTPHLELVEYPPEPTGEMMATYASAGVEQVWKQFPIQWV